MSLAKKMVTDSNAVAQEKGLLACLAFAENCKAAPKTAGEVIDGVVNKCVAAPKTKTKELATQICLKYCEIEAFEKVVEQLLAGLAQKNPKVGQFSPSAPQRSMTSTYSRLCPVASRISPSVFAHLAPKLSRFRHC